MLRRAREDTPLFKQFAVRSETSEHQGFRIRLLVNQEQIGLQVTLAITGPVAGQGMIAPTDRQRLIRGQQFPDRQKQPVKLAAERSRERPLVVFLELLRPQDRPHSVLR